MEKGSKVYSNRRPLNPQWKTERDENGEVSRTHPENNVKIKIVSFIL